MRSPPCEWPAGRPGTLGHRHARRRAVDRDRFRSWRTTGPRRPKRARRGTVHHPRRAAGRTLVAIRRRPTTSSPAAVRSPARRSPGDEQNVGRPARTAPIGTPWPWPAISIRSASVPGVAIRVSARTLEYDSSPRPKRSAVSASTSSARAVRTCSRAAQCRSRRAMRASAPSIGTPRFPRPTDGRLGDQPATPRWRRRYDRRDRPPPPRAPGGQGRDVGRWCGSDR